MWCMAHICRRASTYDFFHRSTQRDSGDEQICRCTGNLLVYLTTKMWRGVRAVCWLSTLGKRVLGKLNRGFKSHPLRHIIITHTIVLIDDGATACYSFPDNCTALHGLVAAKLKAIETDYYRHKTDGPWRLSHSI